MTWPSPIVSALLQGRSLRGGGGQGGKLPPWDFQFLCFLKLVSPNLTVELSPGTCSGGTAPRVFGPGYGPDGL